MHEVTTGKSAQPDRVRDTYNVIEVLRMVKIGGGSSYITFSGVL